MQDWFRDAKLGIFIHWGIYAVNGIPESWSFFNGQISHEDYLKQLDGFTASKYDAGAWAKLFRRAGARYAVLTAKHHDGVALWPTAQSDLNVVDRTPAGRDLMQPYVDALRAEKIHVGIYFSHLDWSHPDYASLPAPFAGSTPEDSNQKTNPFTFRGTRDDAAWERFLTFHRAQLAELCQRYDPELLWFDGDWERNADQWRMKELREFLHQQRPGVILNSRMQGYGDYATPEQGVPIHAPKGDWEFCVTLNDSWGYQGQDNNWKSTRQVVRMFAETIGMGGNLLLDIGPKPDGTIPEPAVERLEALGDWIARHESAVYGTGAGLPHGHFYGATTLSNDRTVLNLIFFDRPIDQIAVKGVRNKVRSAKLLSDGRELTYEKPGGAEWTGIPGTIFIDVPEDAVDSLATVVRLELEGPLDLYTGSGGAVEAN